MSALKRIPTYWLFQLLGWGLCILVNVFYAYTFDRFNVKFVYGILVYLALGIILSHIMRMVINRANILIKPVEQQIFGFIFITFVFSLATGISETFLLDYFNLLHETTAGKKQITVSKLILANSFNSFFYLFIWNCIYYIYHYVQKSRRQQVDTLKLETLVKELELKTIKSHINPHFIFNALNSIRALIDENPLRARGAITELSNILRSSMQSDKLETVPFERELNIVKDYLALGIHPF